MAGATMRQIASEAGYANGALKPYFPTKADLLLATYEYVFQRTNERTDALVGQLRGYDALNAVCREILPLDDNRFDEARVVIAFWGEAITDETAKRVHERSMVKWKESMLGVCAEIDPSRSWESEVDALLTFVTGAQVSAVLMPSVNGSRESLEAQLKAELSVFVAG